MGRGSEQIFFQVRHTDGQQAHEKGSTLLIMKEIQIKTTMQSPHTCQNGKRQQISSGNNKTWKKGKKGNPLKLLVRAKLLQSCLTLRPCGL